MYPPKAKGLPIEDEEVHAAVTAMRDVVLPRQERRDQ